MSKKWAIILGIVIFIGLVVTGVILYKNKKAKDNGTSGTSSAPKPAATGTSSTPVVTPPVAAPAV